MSSDGGERRTVEIMGEVLPVKTAEEGDGTHRALAVVEDKIETIQRKSPDASRLQVALLTCLNLAGQLVRFEDSPDETGLSEGTRDRFRRLNERVDELLSEESP